MASTGESSVPVSPVFEWSFIGSDWEADGTTLISSGMLAEDRYAIGSKVVRSGTATFTYTINKVFYPDAHMFLGVAEITDDPEKAKTFGFSPATGNLYIGEQLNEHGSEQMKTHLLADPKADLVGKQEGSTIVCTVDMDQRKLWFAANGEEPIDAKVELPEDVSAAAAAVAAAAAAALLAPPRPSDLEGRHSSPWRACDGASASASRPRRRHARAALRACRRPP